MQVEPVVHEATDVRRAVVAVAVEEAAKVLLRIVEPVNIRHPVRHLGVEVGSADPHVRGRADDHARPRRDQTRDFMLLERKPVVLPDELRDVAERLVLVSTPEHPVVA